MTLYPVILCGGSGTRLWPWSREHYPKQLLSLPSAAGTLLQETMTRLEGLAAGPAVVVCNEEHRFLVAEQLRQMGHDQATLLLEPVGRNTAPALTLAALWVLDQGAEDALMLAMPADHVIQDTAAFQRAVLLGSRLADDGHLVTFGVIADRAETGYGYIRKGALLAGADADEMLPAAWQVDRFVEKPDAATAGAYVDSGDYLWNSGIFMMRAGRWLEEMRKFNSAIVAACATAYRESTRDGDFFRVERDSFTQSPSDSIDYAVMEKTERAAVVALDATWSDVGAWDALAQLCAADAEGNVVNGDVLVHDTHNSLLMAEQRCVAAVGLNNMIVVETADAVLVADKSRAQEVKEIVRQLKQRCRDEHLFHRKVFRPWGSYEGVDSGERFQVKRLCVNPGAALSLQMHHQRAEHWIVVRGTARVTRDDEIFTLTENQSTYIPLGAKHRLENPGTTPLEIIEVQSGAYLGEDDIVRFEDRYHRS